ncbi:MAG: NAD(+)/NADH kinase [Bryobacteraceae bacterium]
MPGTKTIGIISKPNVRRAAEIVPALIEWLAARDLSVRCDQTTAAYSGRNDGLPREELPKGCDLVIVLGGDGTLLAAARAVAGTRIPLFAVNLGGLGFLTAISIDELYPELERVLKGGRRISTRRMLRCEVVRKEVTVSSYEALNDVVLTKASIARMIDLETFVDGHFVCDYKADGLIISTPTGSTAYSLSAGGPIIFPTVSALCITPVSPHMLTNRPVIVPDSSVIRVWNRGADNETYLTIDGQVGEPLMGDDRVICRSSSHSIQLIRPPRMRFFDVLRDKLRWGER